MYHQLVVKITILIGLTSVIASCATGPVDPEHSPTYNIPVGSSLVLNKEITIPAERLSVYIQRGTVKSFRDVEKYDAYCKFEVRTKQGKDVVIKPDTFIIYRYTTDETIVQNNASPFRRVAEDGGSGITFVETFRVMYLRSEQQPDVLRIACGYRALPPYYNELTVAEVRQAMGDLMTLKMLPK